MTEEFNTLEEYAKTVKTCIENSIHDHQMAADSKPIVIYATPSIAYAKEQEHFANGTNVGPLITFYQSGISFPPEQMMGAFFRLNIKSDEGNYSIRAPLIAEIKYTVTISALTELQADMFTAQLVMATPPTRPYYTFLKGQYVLIKGDEPRNVGSVEVGENKEKVSKRELTLTIERAYLQYDIKDLSAGTIYPDEYFVNSEVIK